MLEYLNIALTIR